MKIWKLAALGALGLSIVSLGIFVESNEKTILTIIADGLVEEHQESQ